MILNFALFILQVFDIVLNGDIVIVPELDIFDKVGRGVGHDEYIPFTISRGRLFCNEEESDIRGGKIRVEFIKGFRDNPKVNAILVVKGKLEGNSFLQPKKAFFFFFFMKVHVKYVTSIHEFIFLALF